MRFLRWFVLTAFVLGAQQAHAQLTPGGGPNGGFPGGIVQPQGGGTGKSNPDANTLTLGTSSAAPILGIGSLASLPTKFIQAPEQYASGLGTQASPFTDSTDNGAGMPTIVTNFATRGGQISLSGGEYSVSGATSITTPGITVQGAALGHNIDPNGLSQGQTGTKILATTSGQSVFTLGSASVRLGGLAFDRFYGWGPSQSDGSKFFDTEGAGGGLDQTRFSNIMLGNVNYGWYVNTVLDAPYFFQTSALGAGYGVYATASGGLPRAQFVADQYSDNANGGITDLSTNLGPFIIGGAFVRNAWTLTTNGANISLASNYGAIIGADIESAGLDLLTSGQVAADNVYINSNHNLVVGSLIRAAADGCGIHITGTATDNSITGNNFWGNTNGATCDILLDSGAASNYIDQDNIPTAVQDNSGAANWLKYLDQPSGTWVMEGNPNSTRNYATLDLVGNSATPFGTFFQLDAHLQTGGHKWAMGATSGANGFGTGFLALIDNTAGKTPFGWSSTGFYANGAAPALLMSTTAPTIASGGCTTGSVQSVSSNNGTAAFHITLGGATCGSSITLTMPSATNAGWVCDAHDKTTPAGNSLDTQDTSKTAVVITNYSRTTGLATNFTGADVLSVKCIGD